MDQIKLDQNRQSERISPPKLAGGDQLRSMAVELVAASTVPVGGRIKRGENVTGRCAGRRTNQAGRKCDRPLAVIAGSQFDGGELVSSFLDA